MMRRHDIANVNCNTTLIEEAMQQLELAKNGWKDFKIKHRVAEEAELLVYYDGYIEEGDTPDVHEK